MFAQRIAARAASRATAQLRATAQRRLASDVTKKEAENAFVAERRHIKEHAGKTTGESLR